MWQLNQLQFAAMYENLCNKIDRSQTLCLFAVSLTFAARSLTIVLDMPQIHGKYCRQVVDFADETPLKVDP